MKRPIVDQILTSLENIQESIENWINIIHKIEILIKLIWYNEFFY